MQAAANAGDRAEVHRLRAALRDVQALVTRPSDLAGLDGGWHLLVLERLFEGGPARLHLVQDGRLIGSADTDTSTLPADPGRLLRFADDAFGDAPDAPSVDEDHHDDEGDEVARPRSWSPEDTTILMRWLAQARTRLEIERLRADDDAERS
jgi:hypothetical protein